MTFLHRRIKRELRSVSATKQGRIDRSVAARPVIMEVGPEEVLSFRVKGTRTQYRLSCNAAMLLAQVATRVKKYNEQMRIYRQRKKDGATKIKRPKVPAMPFNKYFFEML